MLCCHSLTHLDRHIEKSISQSQETRPPEGPQNTGLQLEFPSVVNAVRCAVEVQTAMAERAADIAEDRRIAFRLGINIGDIIV